MALRASVWTASLLIARVASQTSAVSCGPNYAWMTNSLGQDPCTVLAYINTACLGTPYENPAVDAGTGTYDPPTAATASKCTCTKSFYALTEACATCQGGNVIGFQTWSNACTYPQQQATLNVPGNTVLPGWAQLTIADAGTWDPTAAQAFAVSGQPAVTTGTTTTTTSSTTTPSSAAAAASASSVPSSPTSTTKPTSNAQTSSAPVSSSHLIGPILGGAVGGIIIFGLIIVSVWFCLRQRYGPAKSPLVAEKGEREEGLYLTPSVDEEPSMAYVFNGDGKGRPKTTESNASGGSSRFTNTNTFSPASPPSGLSSPPLYPTPNPGQGRYPLPPRPSSQVTFPSAGRGTSPPPGYPAPGFAVNGRPISSRTDPRPLPDPRRSGIGESLPMSNLGPSEGLVVDSRTRPTSRSNAGFEGPVARPVSGATTLSGVTAVNPVATTPKSLPEGISQPRFALEDSGPVMRGPTPGPPLPPKGP